MPTTNKETDPSTPVAMSPDVLSELTVAPLRKLERAKTDPGVGPPSGPQEPPARPMGVVVPPPSLRLESGPFAVLLPEPARRKKDSVEVLLDGMIGPRPDRTRTKPQSDGDAAAAYHVEHGVHAARPAPDELAKVLVDRGPPMTAMNAGRRSRRSVLHLTNTEPAPTLVVRSDQPKRIVVAVVAGLLVVLALLVGMSRRTSRVSSSGPVVHPGLASAPAVPAASPVELPPATAPAIQRPPVATTEPDVDPQATASARVESPPEPSPKPRRPRHKAAAPASSTSGPDLGEFKTTF